MGLSVLTGGIIGDLFFKYFPMFSKSSTTNMYCFHKLSEKVTYKKKRTQVISRLWLAEVYDVWQVYDLNLTSRNERKF